MKTLSELDCKRWLSNNIYSANTSLVLDVPEGKLPKYKYPSDSGKKTALVKMLVNKSKPKGSMLVQTSGCHIWPSSGHVPLLLRLRESLGTNDSLEQYPGLLFQNGEINDVISVLIICVQFLWDCSLCEQGGGTIIMLSHDGWYRYGSNNSEKMDGIKLILSSGTWGEAIP